MESRSLQAGPVSAPLLPPFRPPSWPAGIYFIFWSFDPDAGVCYSVIKQALYMFTLKKAGTLD